VALKGKVERGWVSGGRGMDASGFCGLCVCLGVFAFVVEGACARDWRGLGVCMVGTVCSSVGRE
jgi:hypothetical protein